MENIGGEVTQLAKRLAAIPEINKYDSSDTEEAWTIALSLTDLDEMFCSLQKEYFPRLKQPNLESSEIIDTLIDIGEEFRHIIQHIDSMKFYAYLRQHNE